MRVLWFTGNSAMYQEHKSEGYNGGGWTASLQRELISRYDGKIEMAVAIPWGDDFKEVIDKTTYYGIRRPNRQFIGFRRKEREELARIRQVVEDCHSDIIHVFGTEYSHGLVTTVTDVPTVIHIQGVLTSYKEVWLPQNLSWIDLYVRNPRNWLRRKSLERSVEREKKIFANCKYFMGRTHWDKTVQQLLSPKAEYFYCSEMLRPEIYHSAKTWCRLSNDRQPVVVSVISNPIYKGSDVIVRAAKLLKEYGVDFEWNVYGINNLKLAKRLTGICPEEVGVRACGVVNASQLVEVMTSCSVYVHPSYIENSPNTVCEAQLLGAPIVATNVGGVSSLINNETNGLLVQPGDIVDMASKVKRLIENPQLAESFSIYGREWAMDRHQPESIVDDVVSTYEKIIGKNIK